MAWHRPGDKPLSQPMTVCLLSHICVTRPQWVKIQSIAEPPLIVRWPNQSTPQNFWDIIYCIFFYIDMMALIKNKRVWSCNPGAFREIQDGCQDGRHDCSKHGFGHNSCCIYAIVTILVSNHMFSNTGNSLKYTLYCINIYWENSNYCINFATINGQSCHLQLCFEITK